MLWWPAQQWQVSFRNSLATRMQTIRLACNTSHVALIRCGSSNEPLIGPSAPAERHEQRKVDPVQQIDGTVKLPGSKSVSNRILLLAALADGTTEIENLLVRTSRVIPEYHQEIRTSPMPIVVYCPVLFKSHSVIGTG